MLFSFKCFANLNAEGRLNMPNADSGGICQMLIREVLRSFSNIEHVSDNHQRCGHGEKYIMVHGIAHGYIFSCSSKCRPFSLFKGKYLSSTMPEFQNFQGKEITKIRCKSYEKFSVTLNAFLIGPNWLAS